MANTMQAQVFLEAEKMEMRDVPIPRVGDADVLVKVKNCGICGSDISYFYMWSPPDKMPIILGHEFTGEVVEVGAIPKSMGLFKPGDRVVVNPVQHCNACYACASGHTNLCSNVYVPGVNADGAFAEYALSRYTGLFKLDDAVSYAAGAFIEPLACAVYAMNKLEIEPGQFVAIFGPGPIGIMMTQIAKHTGAGRVAMIGTRDDRLEEAKKWGADYIFNTKDEKSPYYVKDLKSAIADVTHGKLADRRSTRRSERSVRAGDRHHRRRRDPRPLWPAQLGRYHSRPRGFVPQSRQANSRLLAGARRLAADDRHDRQRPAEPGTAGQHGCAALPGRPSHHRPARSQGQPDQGADYAVKAGTRD